MSASILGDYKFPLFPVGVLVVLEFNQWPLKHVGYITLHYRPSNGTGVYIFNSCISDGLRWQLAVGAQRITILATGEVWSCFQPLRDRYDAAPESASPLPS